MDGKAPSVSPQELYARIGTASAPMVVDVRASDAFDADDAMIVGAIRKEPESVSDWLSARPADRQVVVYCVHGHDVSQGVAVVLARSGVQAAYLAEGMSGWRNRQLPTRRKSNEPMDKWVTRERPKIDRIACPWLIRRFIEPRAKFLYVPTADVMRVAAQTGAIPYDIEGVAYAHEGDRCAFDTIIRIHGIADSALDQLATIVRGADTSRHDLAPQCGGLFAISLGLSANIADDHKMLAHRMVMYDALYTWCRSLQAETHNWPAQANAAA